jgi:hypothetical protein
MNVNSVVPTCLLKRPQRRPSFLPPLAIIWTSPLATLFREGLHKSSEQSRGDLEVGQPMVDACATLGA